MQRLILAICFFSSFSLFGQETIKIMTYNVSGGLGKKTEAFQTWMKTQAVDVAAFQEVDMPTDELIKIAKKWKHKYAATVLTDNGNLVVTSKFKIISRPVGGALKASVKGMDFYLTQINQDSFQHRVAAAEAIMATAKKDIADDKEVIVLGHLEGYSLEDSTIYTQRFRAIPIKDRANRDIIKQVASYSRSKNYDLLKVFTENGLTDIVGKMRESEEVESTFPSKKVGDFAQFQTYRVDYILLSETLAKTCSKAMIVKDDFTHKFSDHYPVIIEIAEK